jgi:hypothetical protein
MQGQCFGQYLKYAAQSSGTSGTLVRCPFVDDSAARCDIIIDPSLVDAFNAAVRAAGLGVYRMTCGKPATSFCISSRFHCLVFRVRSKAMDQNSEEEWQIFNNICGSLLKLAWCGALLVAWGCCFVKRPRLLHRANLAAAHEPAAKAVHGHVCRRRFALPLRRLRYAS